MILKLFCHGLHGLARIKYIKDLLVYIILFLAPTTAFLQGALSGERYRVLISSDIGGDDEDDDQSFVHYLMYADLFDTEGFISSPPGKGRAEDFRQVIDVYEKDFRLLKRKSSAYPDPQKLRALVKQGAVDPSPDAGFSKSTEGSSWIIHCARKNDSRPLYILLWGSMTDLAQALHDAPDIKKKIRVHFIASWNQKQDEKAFQYINLHHPDLWMIHDNSSFRGWYTGGMQEGEFGNKAFVEKYIAGHGALGSYFAPLKDGSIKMGDSPTVARLLNGDPEDPEKESWGGQFMKLEGRKTWWVDLQVPAFRESNYPGAKTVNKWRREFLSDWQMRMKTLEE